MKYFKWMWLLPVVVVLAGPLPVAGQTPESFPQDFLLLEVLLSMQGAVIGEGLGVFLSNEGLQLWDRVFDLPCYQPAPELITGCQISQSFRALCIGSALGVPLGATYLGVWLAGPLLDVQGNLPAALLGGMLGELIGLPQCSLFSFLQDWGVSLAFFEELGISLTLNSPTNSDLSLLLNQRTLAALGATLGYNLDWLLSGKAPATQNAPLGLPAAFSLTIPIISIQF